MREARFSEMDGTKNLQPRNLFNLMFILGQRKRKKGSHKYLLLDLSKTWNYADKIFIFVSFCLFASFGSWPSAISDNGL